MLLIKSIHEMQEWSRTQKLNGKSIAFVPTMGALHEGHLSLLREGRKLCDKLILSIYVNPTQFGPNEDISCYPRNLKGDLKSVEPIGVDAVFTPSDKIMYPEGYETYVDVHHLTDNLCGLTRAGHFRGVTTIVTKLFNITMSDVAIFGEKDFQQLAIIRRMTKDLNLPIEIVGCPTVREADGVAMSSRNACLSDNEGIAARSIYQSLLIAKDMVESGETRVEKITAKVEEALISTNLAKIDYVKIVDAETMEDINTFKRPALIAIAVLIGKTRLIDNMLFKV